MTYRKQILIDSLSFDIEAVGGRNGISKAYKLKTKLVLSKHGDYDGRTIIIDNHGKITDFIGGILFYDPASNLLLSIYESDIGGISVYDLDTGVLLFEKSNFETYPTKLVKVNNKDYYLLCEGDDGTTNLCFRLDIENKKLSRADLSEIESQSITDLNQINDADVNCECTDNSAIRQNYD